MSQGINMTRNCQSLNHTFYGGRCVVVLERRRWVWNATNIKMCQRNWSGTIGEFCVGYDYARG